MSATAFPKLPTHAAAPRSSRRQTLGRSALLLGTTVVLSLVPVATVAQASPLPARAASTCSKVSAASVAAVVGHRGTVEMSVADLQGAAHRLSGPIGWHAV